jgi:hypothetical protein
MLVDGVFAIRNERTDAAFAGRPSIDLGVIPLVGHGGAGPNVGSDVEQCLELPAVACFTTGQMEAERETLEVGFEVDFCREPAARAAARVSERLCKSGCGSHS